jgi:hypothetical protein
MNTGDFVFIDGAQDPEANIYGQVGTVTATTFELLRIDGTSIAGTLAGGAFGSTFSLAFGTRVPLPDDVTDDMDATSVNVPMEELADRTAYALYLIEQFQPTLQHYEGSVSPETIIGTGAFADAGVSWVDISGGRPGDVYVVNIQTSASTTAGSHTIRAAIYEDFGGALQLLVPLFEYSVGTTVAKFDLIGARTGTRAGPARVIVQSKSTIGQNVTLLAGHILVTRFRRGFAT